MRRKHFSIFILFFILFINSSTLFFQHKDKFTDKVNYQALKTEYQNSQYENPNASDWIDDPTLYTYAGIEYAKGIDPSTLNFELQPLTKYLFGISIYIFKNPAVFQLIFYNLLLVFTYLLARKIIKNSIIATLPSLILSVDPIIRVHAYTPYVDMFQAVIILLCLLFIPKNKKALTYFLFGILALTKSFMIGLLMFFSYLTFLFTNNKLKVKQVVAFSLISIITYFFGYLAFFAHSHGVVDFFNLHIKIAKLYRGYVPEYPKFEVFRIIIFGKWRKWFDDFGLAQVDNWWIIWPISLISSILYSLKYRLSLKNSHSQILVIFSTFYLITISLKLVFPRYIIPLLPLFYIFTIKFFISKIKNKNYTKISL